MGRFFFFFFLIACERLWSIKVILKLEKNTIFVKKSQKKKKYFEIIILQYNPIKLCVCIKNQIYELSNANALKLLK